MNQRQMNNPKVCEQCGTTFYPFRASTGQFCSNICKFKAKEKTYTYNCLECGATVAKKIQQGKYCSDKCYRNHKTNRSAIDRLMEFIDKTDYCWLWTSGTNKAGYGRLYFGGKEWLAHRLMYHTVTGEDVTGVTVRHFECDNPPCCNPAHLKGGTMGDNSQDAVSKGRHAHGETSYAKLTEADALAIIADSRKHKDIAKDYLIARRTVGHIKTGYTWKHLPR